MIRQQRCEESCCNQGKPYPYCNVLEGLGSQQGPGLQDHPRMNKYIGEISSVVLVLRSHAPQLVSKKLVLRKGCFQPLYDHALTPGTLPVTSFI